MNAPYKYCILIGNIMIMKKTHVNTIFRKGRKLFLGVVFFTLLFSCIKDEPQLWVPKDINLQITEYLELNEEFYSEFMELIRRADFDHLLSARGPYTLFLPTNDAMQNYYTFKGINSIDDLSLDDMDKLVRTHLFTFLIQSSSIGLGSISDTNALGDFISSEFIGTDIVIGKYSKIIKRDIVNANGYIHVLDRAIDPVIKNVYDVISEKPEYSIFTEGLIRAGLDDDLQKILTEYGNMMVRVWYTILAVPDDVYNSQSIFSIDDLISRYDDGNGVLTDNTNGFYKYMEYHCLEGVYYLSSFEPGLYPIISRENYINLKIDSTYKINYNPADSSFVRFIFEDANVSAKNGVLHKISGLLPAQEVALAPIVFQVTDFPDLRANDCYHNYIKNFMDGQNSFAKIKWQGDYLQYYYKTSEAYRDHDCLSMSQGFWWLEITVPKVPKGNYNVSGYFKVGENRADMITYIDGTKMDIIVKTRASSKSFETIEIGDVEWTETSEHTFKFVTLVPGIVYLDRLIYTPK